jgi:hypothetical protein
MSATQQLLTPTEEEIVEFLPATTREISSEFEIRTTTVRDHLSAIRQKVGLFDETNDEGVAVYSPVYGSEEVPYTEEVVEETLEEEREGAEVSDEEPEVRSKQAITKEANTHVLDLQSRMERILANTESPEVPAEMSRTNGHEDVVIHRTDDHIGDVVKNEFGDEIFELAQAKGFNIFNYSSIRSIP